MSCPDCFKGAIRDATPQGTTTHIHGLETYVADPPNGAPPKGIIVIIPDAFGWVFPNNRLLADNYAAKGGYRVYLPDFMNGYSAPVYMLENMQSASATGNYFSKAYYWAGVLWAAVPWSIRNVVFDRWPHVKGFFEQLRKDEGATLGIGAAGFCWGGKHTVSLAHGAEIDGKKLVDAAYTGHPSLLNIPGDIERIALPVSFALASDDMQISPAQAERLKSIMDKKTGAARGEVKIYPNSSHGFAVRADVKLRDVAKQAEDAEQQCITFFDAHLKKP